MLALNQESLKSKKSLIFDLDGTLWDTTIQIKLVWNNVAKKYNIDIEKINIDSIMGLTNTEIVSALFANNIELGEKFLIECQHEENKYLSINGGNIYKHTILTLQKLAKRFNLYIVSNCQSGYIESFLTFYKLNNLFNDYECSGKTGLTKSENIELLKKRNNIVHSIYIGDTNNDYLAAVQSGCTFIFADYGFGNCKKYDFLIDDISDLLHIL